MYLFWKIFEKKVYLFHHFFKNLSLKSDKKCPKRLYFSYFKNDPLYIYILIYNIKQFLGKNRWAPISTTFKNFAQKLVRIGPRVPFIVEPVDKISSGFSSSVLTAIFAFSAAFATSAKWLSHWPLIGSSTPNVPLVKQKRGQTRRFFQFSLFSSHYVLVLLFGDFCFSILC